MSDTPAPKIIRVLVLLDKGQAFSRGEHQTLVAHLQQRAPGWEIKLTNTDYMWTQHRRSFPAFVARMTEIFDVFVRPIPNAAESTCGRGSQQIIKSALNAGKRVRTWDGTALTPILRTEYIPELQLYRLAPT